MTPYSVSYRIQTALLVLIVILSCYYLWVLYKAVTPNVSVAYKAYYIKRQTLYWDANKPNLQLPIPCRLSIDSNSPYLSRQGWSSEVFEHSRQLISQGGLYFTVAKLVVMPVTLTLILAHPASVPIHVAFNQWHGTLVPSPAQRRVLTLQLPANAFFEPKKMQQLTFLNPEPLVVQQINIE
ncbi:MAG: riboflavin synthase subunit alpha [Vibrio fluvialis]